VQWRKFKEINIVDLRYRPANYGHWAPMPSGLNSEVRLIPVDFTQE
jgi:glycoside hydrolase family 2